MTARQSRKKSPPAEAPADPYWEERARLEKKGKKLFTQTIFHDWCKACGICIRFCPKQVFEKNGEGKPVVVRPDLCIGCRFCETHCPDFAIAISERFPDRRRRQDDK